jgi:hypothetical protein
MYTAREALAPEIAEYVPENIAPPRSLPKALFVAHRTAELLQWEASAVFS